MQIFAFIVTNMLVSPIQHSGIGGPDQRKATAQQCCVTVEYRLTVLDPYNQHGDTAVFLLFKFDQLHRDYMTGQNRCFLNFTCEIGPKGPYPLSNSLPRRSYFYRLHVGIWETGM